MAAGEEGRKEGEGREREEGKGVKGREEERREGGEGRRGREGIGRGWRGEGREIERERRGQLQPTTLVRSS